MVGKIITKISLMLLFTLNTFSSLQSAAPKVPTPNKRAITLENKSEEVILYPVFEIVITTKESDKKIEKSFVIDVFNNKETRRYLLPQDSEIKSLMFTPMAGVPGSSEPAIFKITGHSLNQMIGSNKDIRIVIGQRLGAGYPVKFLPEEDAKKEAEAVDAPPTVPAAAAAAAVATPPGTERGKH